MASGDIRTQYGTSTNLTVTALNGGIASSSAWIAGWTSGVIDNSASKDLDHAISAKFTVESVGLSAGEIRVYLYTMLDDSTWPDIFSAGTEGTEGTATLHDTEIRDELYLLWATVTDITASRVYSMLQTSIVDRVGFMPEKYALFVAHSTGTTLETSGQQITVKALNQAVAP